MARDLLELARGFQNLKLPYDGIFLMLSTSQGSQGYQPTRKQHHVYQVVKCVIYMALAASNGIAIITVLMMKSLIKLINSCSLLIHLHHL